MDFSLINVAYALTKDESLDQFISNANRLIVNPLIALLFALALMFFLYGVFEFLANSDNEEKKTKGKSHMIWGIIGITIMMGVWTILNIILNTFNLNDVNPEQGTVHLSDYSPDYPAVGNQN